MYIIQNQNWQKPCTKVCLYIISHLSWWFTGWLWWPPCLQWLFRGYCLLGYQLCKPILSWGVHPNQELRSVDQLAYWQWHTINTHYDPSWAKCRDMRLHLFTLKTIWLINNIIIVEFLLLLPNFYATLR